MNSETKNEPGREHGRGDGQGHGHRMSYLRFAAMIATAVVVMYGVMFIDTYALDHVQWSESRMYMAITMGAVMTLVMLGWMWSMYANRAVNLAIVGVTVLVLAGSVHLDRSQTTIQDEAFMSSMIPHHSMAILRAERAGLSDVRVCELAVAISEAQRREIEEMEWLINDIEQNGPALTVDEARSRQAPEFERSAERSCPARGGTATPAPVRPGADRAPHLGALTAR